VLLVAAEVFYQRGPEEYPGEAFEQEESKASYTEAFKPGNNLMPPTRGVFWDDVTLCDIRITAAHLERKNTGSLLVVRLGRQLMMPD
jgi:hypothetical protein